MLQYFLNFEAPNSSNLEFVGKFLFVSGLQNDRLKQTSSKIFNQFDSVHQTSLRYHLLLVQFQDLKTLRDFIFSEFCSSIFQVFLQCLSAFLFSKMNREIPFERTAFIFSAFFLPLEILLSDFQSLLVDQCTFKQKIFTT